MTKAHDAHEAARLADEQYGPHDPATCPDCLQYGVTAPDLGDGTTDHRVALGDRLPNGATVFAIAVRGWIDEKGDDRDVRVACVRPGYDHEPYATWSMDAADPRSTTGGRYYPDAASACAELAFTPAQQADAEWDRGVQS